MKKLGLALFSIALTGALLSARGADVTRARALYSTEQDHPVGYLGVSLATPLQYPAANSTIKGVRLNLLYGENYGVYGLDLGLTGLNRDRGCGAAIDVLGSWTDGDYDGFQYGSIANIVCGNATGFQLSPVANYVKGDFVGVQLAKLNFGSTVTGVQLGALNYDKGVVNAFQLAAVNVNRSEFCGLSIGALNYAERMVGCQIGVLNVAAEAGRGMQIGLFNTASTYTGMQIGFMNLIGNGTVPAMPFINAQF